MGRSWLWCCAAILWQRWAVSAMGMMKKVFATAFQQTFKKTKTIPTITPKLTSSKKYTKKDAARDTRVSVKEVSKAWHQARVDAQKSGLLPERKARKAAQAARVDAQKLKSGLLPEPNTRNAAQAAKSSTNSKQAAKQSRKEL
mmetsp:Transcript_39195/g.73078  ORF Transcript_39195/g.73078 Transcript_39195/m.73078 type:complete len:143 (-) Transcript_39195:102-530(-)